MNTKNLRRCLKEGWTNSKHFIVPARYVVKIGVAELPTKPLTAAQRESIAQVMSIDFATGAALVKRKYLLYGVIIGCCITGGVILIRRKFEKRA